VNQTAAEIPNGWLKELQARGVDLLLFAWRRQVPPAILQIARGAGQLMLGIPLG